MARRSRLLVRVLILLFIVWFWLNSDTVMTVVKRLIVARHAESEYNVLGLLNGDPSVPCALTARGRNQAGELGRALAKQAIDLCVTTDFPGTRETADVALAGRNIPLLVVRELNDPPNGLLEGRPPMRSTGGGDRSTGRMT